jgi:hypothetical protein
MGSWLDLTAQHRDNPRQPDLRQLAGGHDVVASEGALNEASKGESVLSEAFVVF